MKINADQIVRLRLEKPWTQEEFAIATGLGLRTIQRIEKEGLASVQSIKCLAAALETDVEKFSIQEPKTGYQNANLKIIMFAALSLVIGFVIGWQYSTIYIFDLEEVVESSTIISGIDERPNDAVADSKQDLSDWVPRRITRQDLNENSEMRVISTPFGDRLVPVQ